jgi:hypothetical protein
MMRTAVLVLAIAACKSGGGTAAGSGSAPAEPAAAAAANGDVTGEWSGSWHRDKPVPGGGELHLSIGAKTTLKRVGTACPPEETPATVTVTGNTVKIEVATDEVKATYTGTRNGKEMSGELTTTCKIGTGAGTWKLSAP